MNSRALGTVMVGLAATMVVAGCTPTSNGVGASGRATGTATPSAPSSSVAPTAGPTTADVGTVLEAIAVHPNDLSKGYTVRLIPDGNQVLGQVTLDNCGYDFTTETDRIARRQYEILAGSAESGLSNEVVAYDTATHAAQAVDQWYASAAGCPRGPVRSMVAGVPKVRTTVRQNARDIAGLPGSDNVVTEESLASAHEGTVYTVTILQVQGRYLDALYYANTSAVTAGERAAAVALAVVTGRRLVTQH